METTVLLGPRILTKYLPVRVMTTFAHTVALTSFMQDLGMTRSVAVQVLIYSRAVGVTIAWAVNQILTRLKAVNVTIGYMADLVLICVRVAMVRINFLHVKGRLHLAVRQAAPPNAIVKLIHPTFVLRLENPRFGGDFH
jgi:hypothetical protein